MKRLFRKIAEFFGLVAKQPKENVQFETNWEEIDEAPIFQEEEKPLTPYGQMSEGITDNGLIEPDAQCPTPKEVLNSRDEETPPRPIKLPKDANDIQRLTRYNNPKTVYRDSKGRFASLK